MAATPQSFIFRPRSFFERLDLAQLFPVSQPLEAELGSGDGSFLAAYARLHPERNFIGVERLLGRLRKLDRKAQRGGLENIRLLRIEAAYFVEYMLPPNATQALHVYFPDPWPKRRHWKHRLVNERFPELARKALAPGGRVYLRTDNDAYFAQMQEVFAAHKDFAAIPTPEDLLEIQTDFEREFVARGLPIHRAAYESRG